MAGTESELLRHYELRLLRCSLPDTNRSLPHPPSPPSDSLHPLNSLIDTVVGLIESGYYVEALSSEAARALFGRLNVHDGDSLEAAEFYSELDRAIVELCLEDSGGYGALLLLSLAVAAFFAFLQCNVTGPVIQLPEVPFTWIKFVDGPSWEAWAKNQLISAGSDLLGKFSSLQFLVFAKTLFMKTKDVLFREDVDSGVVFTRSISWWLFRSLLLQQRILDDRCSSLFNLLQVLIRESLTHFGRKDDIITYWGTMLHEEEASTIVALLHLEAGLMEHTFGRVDSGREHFRSAESIAGLNLSVIGALGFRTIHQVEPKAQMVLVSNNEPSHAPTTRKASTENGSLMSDDRVPEKQSENGEASDVLMTPRFVDDGGNNVGVSASGINLNAIRQMVILAQCLLIEKSARQDEMQRWEMAPYIEAIDSQQSSYFMVRCFCNILRVRWESTRGRTKERSLLMMEKLVQGLLEAQPKVQERIQFCFGVYIPPVPALRKEYGLLLVSQGLVGEALKIFEDLELWDNLIFCYRLLEKKAAAVELIKARLSETPSDPRLWCSLGDVTNDDACYHKALEVSSDRSARAKRSLARSAYNKEDYETSLSLWESAMQLNSLYPDGWFALGAAALKARNIDKAVDGFTRAVQLDPDNGEAWNNIACLHMLKKRNKESFIAFKEALKHKRNSWQMWENFSHVAADVDNFSQAMEAIQTVLDLSRGKRIDFELLERLVLELERRVSSQDRKIPVDETTSGSECAQSRETEHLINLLGKLLQQIVKNGANGDMWGLFARWQRMKGDLQMCAEARLKQVRSYQGADVWKDIDRFKKFAHASLELCEVYLKISSSTGSIKELRTAEMHLRNTIKQASSFSETQEFRQLEVCLDEVKARLDGF